MNALPTAVFLDRDGTIIEDAHYISTTDQVRLLPGAGEAVARINATLVPVILITNQSGIGRGLFTVEDYARVSQRVEELLAEKGAHIDAAYYCPHRPDDHCECRKPGVLLFRRAADDHPEIDLSRALYIGDRMRDIEPALVFGGTGVLVESPETPLEERERAARVARTAPSLSTALDWYLCTN